MAVPKTQTLTIKVLPILASLQVFTGWMCCNAAVTPLNVTTNITQSSFLETSPDTMTSRVLNATEFPGNVTTIHPASTTPTAPKPNLTTGEIIGIVIGVVCGGTLVVVLVLCLRKNSGYQKAVSAPVTYRKGSNLRTDRAPLTTKDKDPSPLPGGGDDHFFYDEKIRKLDPSSLKTFAKRPTSLIPQSDRASLDGDNTSAKDGGDDDYFYDEIFGDSAFTDATTNASIKELSSPKDEELPELIFRDEFDFDEDDPFS